jgi:hypothetical protein
VNDWSWSLGTLIGFPLGIFAALIGAVLVWVCIRWWKRERGASYGDGPLAIVGIVVGSLMVAGALIGTGVGMWPYSAEYHQWRTTTGTVQAVGSRLLGDGTGTTQRFVVTLAGIGQRSCDDTRCAEVKVGDRLTLSCKRAWQYSGTPGYDCNYLDDER